MSFHLTRKRMPSLMQDNLELLEVFASDRQRERDKGGMDGPRRNHAEAMEA
jgi:hypothetical protein